MRINSTKSTYSDQNFLATLDNKRLIYSDPDSQFDFSGTFNDQKIVTNRSGGAPSQFEFFFLLFYSFFLRTLQIWSKNCRKTFLTLKSHSDRQAGAKELLKKSNAFSKRKENISFSINRSDWSSTKWCFYRSFWT